MDSFAGKAHSLTDELGKYVAADLSLCNKCGWEKLVTMRRGRHPLAPTVKDLQHPASHLLWCMRTCGVPVQMATAPWTAGQLAAAVARGPHPSAKLHSEFVIQEMIDMWHKGQMTLLPIEVALTLPHVRLSPPAPIEQRGRRNRNLLDLSFCGINRDAAPLAPAESMQFGHAFRRLLERIYRADPRHGPACLMKNDLSDAFFVIMLALGGIAKLGSILPKLEHHAQQVVAFHAGLPMGWTQSPPWLAAVTETIADVANQRTQQHWDPPPHRLEELADTPAEGRPTLDALQDSRPGSSLPQRFVPPPAPPLGVWEVHMDDFIAAAQGDADHLRRIRRTLLHVVDEVFEPPLPGSSRKEPSSLKKMRQGDAAWDLTKEVLGWIINILRGTVELPERRKQRLLELLAEHPRTRRRASAKNWHKLLGELRSMALAIPGLAGAFSILQDALADRIKLTAAVHDQLDDIRWLAKDLVARPTRIAEMVPGPADFLGATDACGNGLGVVLLPLPTSRRRFNHPPVVARLPWPDDVRQRLVTAENMSGNLTMGDTELAGRLAGDLLLRDLALNLTEANVYFGCDNQNAQSWQTKGSATSSGARACLLRASALLRRHHRYQSHTIYLPGPWNDMADDASRRWDLTDSQLLSHFNTLYPQSESWRLVHLPTDSCSVLTSSLRCARVEPEAICRGPAPETKCGRSGPDSAARSDKMNYYSKSTTPHLYSSRSCADTAMDGSPRKVTQYLLERSKMWCGKSAPRSKNWGPRMCG